MLNRAILSAEHAELIDIADLFAIELRALTPNLERLASLRLRFSRVLLLHLAQEDHLLYPTLKRTTDGPTRELAARFEAEMGQLGDIYRRYVTRWSSIAIAQDWDGFRTDTRSFLAALRRRIRREETELYPRMPIVLPDQNISRVA